MTDVEQNSGNYVLPVLMALVIVHYRQGKTEDAIFWFNAGRLRAQFDAVVPHLTYRQGMRQAIGRKHSEICPKHHGERRSWTL